MSNPSGKTILVLGATGNAGKHVVRHALDAGDDVCVFVRDPRKLPPAIKDRVDLIVGDLTDRAAVTEAVKRVSPSAILICSGHPPKDPVGPLNATAVAAIVEALTETRRLDECLVVYLSGLFANPLAEPLPWYARLLRAIMVPLFGYQASLRDNLEVTEYLTAGEGLRSGLRFAIVRMGYPVEAPSKGRIVPVADYPAGAVTFDDMGLFLVGLAHAEYRQETLGKAIKVFYAREW